MTLQYRLMTSKKQINFDQWLNEVTAGLASVNMSVADWQSIFPFDFQVEYDAGVTPRDAAMKANRYWWHEQNKSLKRECLRTPTCWLPRHHEGICQPVDAVGKSSGMTNTEPQVKQWSMKITKVDGTIEEARYPDGSVMTKVINSAERDVKSGKIKGFELAMIEADVNSAKIPIPTYERGDYIKVEFPDEATGIGEWMWVRVNHCDDEKKLVFGTLDNEPVNDHRDKIALGSELAVSYSQIREHKKPTEFTKQ